MSANTKTLAFLAGVGLIAAARWPAQPSARQQPANVASFAEMRWRPIGPFRGRRTKAITGLRMQPNVFYIGAVNGGVWKTTDFGRTWTPIFDDQPTGSVGAIAVAPSDPNVVYVGSGEGLTRPDLSVGDGIDTTIGAGKTWTHLGLRDGQQIPYPDTVIIASTVSYRSTDGGRTWIALLARWTALKAEARTLNLAS